MDITKLGGLKTEIYLHLFWRLDVQDQDVDRSGVSEASALGLQMAAPPCVLARPFLCMGTLLVSLPLLVRTPLILD